jgi:hypothetical protein
MSEFTVKPAPGKAVRDPRTMEPLAANGERKPRDTFWLRRLAAGDVVVVDDKSKPKGKAK